MTKERIISDVADIYGITVNDIMSKRRLRNFADARAVICYFLCFMHGFSTIEAGKVIGRNHATVVYYNKKTRDWIRKPILNDRGAKAIKELEERYG